MRRNEDAATGGQVRRKIKCERVIAQWHFSLFPSDTVGICLFVITLEDHDHELTSKLFKSVLKNDFLSLDYKILKFQQHYDLMPWFQWLKGFNLKS
jgi:hypothetical protein